MCSLPVIKGFFIGLIFFITSGFLQLAAQELPINPDDNDPQRTEPIEPFRIIDNVYYVGATVHHSAYLFTSQEGHILLVRSTLLYFIPPGKYSHLKPNFDQFIIVGVWISYAHQHHLVRSDHCRASWEK